MGAAGPRQPPTVTPGSFNPNVHGARGLFAFLVFLFHVENSGLPTSPFLRDGLVDGMLRSSEYGVELFFCISGFVVVDSLASRRSAAAFLRDRAIRILPVLWTSLLVIIPLGWLAHKPGDDLPLATLAWLLPANMLVLPGALPLPAIHAAAWSLSYEWVFYLVCAAGWMLRRRLGSRATLAVLAPVIGLLVCIHPRGLFFLSGAIALRGGAAIPRWLARHPAAWLAVFLAAWQAVQHGPGPLNADMLLDGSAAATLGLGLVAFVAATVGFSGLVAGHGALGLLLRSRVMQGLGTISYSFYLWHPIVMSAGKAGMLASGAAAWAGDWAQALPFALALPPSLVVAVASQRLIERRLGHWLHARTGPSPRQMAVDPPGVPAACGDAEARALRPRGGSRALE